MIKNFKLRGGFMKKLFLIAFISLFGTMALANSDCKDSNLNDLDFAVNYDEIDKTGKFVKLYSSDSPAPAGYEEIFGDGDTLCHAVEATYYQHKATGKKYVVFSTWDDYCDGGNTIGVMIDMDLYIDQKLEEAAVAEVGDSEMYCKTK